MPEPVTGEAWAGVARASRDALALLGYHIEPNCLPGEERPCGAGWAMHAAAHLATLKAVADHQLAHLAPPQTLVDDVYQATRTQLDHGQAGDGAEIHHPPGPPG